MAFGGNAIARAGERGSYDEQLRNIKGMCHALATLVAAGHNVLITHGNGPQVGQIALQQDIASDQVPPMPFDAAGAMSEGQIGYMLQQGLHNTLLARGIERTCVTVVTQVIVSADDPAFQNPTKPVGRFYSLDEAEALRSEKGWTMVEDAGRGYRRVVPSPRPLYIVEWPAIAALIASGCIVIAAGGGGIPVVAEESEKLGESVRSGTATDEMSLCQLRGVEAVIDKDRAAERLASLVAADTLVLLTDVPQVAVDFGTAQERWLDRVSVAELREHFDAGEFPAGSMGPKVESALRFVENPRGSAGARAIITSAANLVDSVERGGGTQVVAAAPDRLVAGAGGVESAHRREPSEMESGRAIHG